MGCLKTTQKDNKIEPEQSRELNGFCYFVCFRGRIAARTGSGPKTNGLWGLMAAGQITEQIGGIKGDKQQGRY